MQRIQTKEQRTNIRAAQFESLLKNGYSRETYKTCDIFTKQDGCKWYAKAFRGTSTNQIFYYSFNSLERMEQKIKETKEFEDRREQRKIDEKGNKRLSSHAAAAKAIREELKTAFPSVKFSVTSESFSMGNSVRVDWTNGATEKQVSEIVSKYQYGHFDGMSDMYENSNSRDDIPQTKYVQTSRSMSEEVKQLSQFFEHLSNGNDWENRPENILYRVFNKCHIEPGAQNLRIERTNENSGSFEGIYTIAYDLPENENRKAAVNQIEPGKVQIVEYSEKSIAVIGETYPIKDKLKSIGGKFNKFLSCGAGWIFPKSKFEDIKNLLSNTTKPGTQGIDSEPTNESKEQTKAPQVSNLPEPLTAKYKNLEYFKILWHEGHQTPNFTDAIFTNWQEVQKAFYKLWEVNEKGQDGGYTKVKCEIKFKGVDAVTDRIYITNRVNNGDFNPSQMHVLEYLRQTILEEGEEIEEPAKDWRKHPELEHRHPLNICDPESNQYKEALKEYEAEHPKKYKNIIDITAAAKSGKPISIYNLFDIVNTQTVNA